MQFILLFLTYSLSYIASYTQLANSSRASYSYLKLLNSWILVHHNGTAS